MPVRLKALKRTFDSHNLQPTRFEFMDLAPPSSKRLRTAETDISVVAKSPAMQELLNRCIKYSMRGWYVTMVTPPDDAFEFNSFVKEIVSRRLVSEPHVVSPTDTTVLWRNFEECAASDRGLVILKAEALTEAMLDELARLERNGRSRQVLIVNFRSKSWLERRMEEWPKAVKKSFKPKPLRWPKLGARKADLPALADALCETLVSQDGSRRAKLAPAAKEMLFVDTYKSVAALYQRIRDGFDVMLRTNEPTIVPRHLMVASNPRQRANLFSSPAIP
ncbi:hypothetical protein HY479_00900 [Candidatus Uhrbacteria bacterium]|nr:hypothetical protein [Candidatus Uhrbacteria bacterium]